MAKRKTAKKRAKKATKKKAKKTAKRTTKKKAAKRPAKRAAKRKPAKKKATRKPAKRTAKKRQAKKKSKRKLNPGFMKPVTPDAKLAVIVGSKPLPRTELTKKLWAYIKKKRLQDKKNRRNINADAPLKAVFNGKATVDMFAMTKFVSKHLE